MGKTLGLGRVESTQTIDGIEQYASYCHESTIAMEYRLSRLLCRQLKTG